MFIGIKGKVINQIEIYIIVGDRYPVFPECTQVLRVKGQITAKNTGLKFY